MTRAARLADLRRLYLHILGGCAVDPVIDSARLSLAIGDLETADRTIAELSAALRNAIDSLEYVERKYHRQQGYGVRRQRIAAGRAALALAETSSRTMIAPTQAADATGA